MITASAETKVRVRTKIHLITEIHVISIIAPSKSCDFSPPRASYSPVAGCLRGSQRRRQYICGWRPQ
jgi:hypothetical protein